MLENKINPEIEIIDIEVYSLSGEIPQVGKKYKIRVDGKEYVFLHHIVTGAEILHKAEKIPIECHQLYLKLKDCDYTLIHPHEEVDLIKGNVEHFITKPPAEFHYFIDTEKETTKEKELTPNQILEKADLKPITDYYIVEIHHDGSQTSYEGKPNKPIKMKCPGLRFTAIYNGETPVS